MSADIALLTADLQHLACQLTASTLLDLEGSLYQSIKERLSLLD